jgi:carboxyl-terminal processing protease
VKPGWEIVQIADEEVPPLFAPLYEEFENSARLEHYLVSAVISRLSGAIGDTVAVTFVDGDGAQVEKTLELQEPRGKKVVFGYLPPLYLRVKVDTLAGDIGYFYFSFFFDPQLLMTEFNRFMESSLEAPGIIIDIRGNGGGIGGLAMGIGGWLTSEKNLYLGTLTTRETELKLIINPRAKTYQGPVVILVDGLSASSSEFLAGGLQAIGRAHITGTRTVGAALPSMIEKLPNGDGFQYAFGDYVSASGEALEGNGVTPDQEVSHSREALLAGRDLMLEAAIEWIRSETQ